jgi:hypothetical protein
MSRAAITLTAGAPVPHLVKPQDLEESGRIFKGRVEATDHALKGE